MNYIKKLESENKILRDNMAEAEDDINSIMRYLLSSKFHNDPTVQIQDMLNRIEYIRSSLRGFGPIR